MPNLVSIGKLGSQGLAQSVIPSFTNPNNVAIVTGTPPNVNGICGNYFYNQLVGEEVMMNAPEHLRCSTILSAFSQAEYSVGVVTTKEKLRRLLGKDTRGVCISVEDARSASLDENGIEGIEELVGRAAPSIYDPDISVYCLEVGLRLMAVRETALLYLSTTDFVQHKYGPGSPEAQMFYGRLDQLIGEFDGLGAIIGITADHGMNDKVNADGSPRVQFLETILAANSVKARVVLPITDPYVVHHGALGSYATVYFNNGDVENGRKLLERVPGVELVLNRVEAHAQFLLPPDRIGDLIVLSDQSTTLGKTPEWHDLAAVRTGLRSHGGLHERSVPFIVNRRLRPSYDSRLRSGEVYNYDLFDFLLNGIKD